MDLLIPEKNPGRKMQEKSLDSKPVLTAHGCNELSHLQSFFFTGHHCWGEEYLASYLNSVRVVGVQHC